MENIFKNIRRLFRYGIIRIVYQQNKYQFIPNFKSILERSFEILDFFLFYLFRIINHFHTSFSG